MVGRSFPGFRMLALILPLLLASGVFSDLRRSGAGFVRLKRLYLRDEDHVGLERRKLNEAMPLNCAGFITARGLRIILGALTPAPECRQLNV